MKSDRDSATTIWCLQGWCLIIGIPGARLASTKFLWCYSVPDLCNRLSIKVRALRIVASSSLESQILKSTSLVAALANAGASHNLPIPASEICDNHNAFWASNRSSKSKGSDCSAVCAEKGKWSVVQHVG